LGVILTKLDWDKDRSKRLANSQPISNYFDSPGSTFFDSIDKIERHRYSINQHGRDFCRPSRCPHCTSNVFFIPHNGGLVCVDKLDWPWPRHACDPNNNYLAIEKLKTEIITDGTPPFLGLVTKTEKSRNAKNQKISTIVRINGIGSECRDVSIEGDVCSELEGQLIALILKYEGYKLKTVINSSIKSFDIMTLCSPNESISKIDNVKTQLNNMKVTFCHAYSYNTLKSLLKIEVGKRTVKKDRKLLEDKLRKLQIDFPSSSTNDKLRKLYKAKVEQQKLYAKRNSLLEKIAAKTGLTQNQVSSVLDEITVLMEHNTKKSADDDSDLPGLVNIEFKRRDRKDNELISSETTVHQKSSHSRPLSFTSDAAERDGSFVTDANGIVRDIKTGFEWKVGPDKDTDWDEARHWVKSLDFGAGWRMPTIDELESLYNIEAGERNMTHLLKTTGLSAWSSETKGSSMAKRFNFFHGRKWWRRYKDCTYTRAFAVRSRK
jgi:hypothetical protein